jgi:hypothetical protein
MATGGPCFCEWNFIITAMRLVAQGKCVKKPYKQKKTWHSCSDDNIHPARRKIHRLKTP